MNLGNILATTRNISFKTYSEGHDKGAITSTIRHIEQTPSPETVSTKLYIS